MYVRGWSKTVAKFVDTVHLSTPGNNFAAGRHNELSESETAQVCVCVCLCPRYGYMSVLERRKSRKQHVGIEYQCIVSKRMGWILHTQTNVGQGPQCTSSSAAFSSVCMCMCVYTCGCVCTRVSVFNSHSAPFRA